MSASDPSIPDGASAESGLLLQNCPVCQSEIDVSDQEALTKIACPVCGAEVLVGEWVGPYRLLSVAGRGGMGVVYKALDSSLDRPVALKVLRKDRLTAESLAQLETEASITASINHPHVVKVFTTGTDHGRFYLAMELVDKGTLDDLIHLQGRVAETQALDVAIQVSQGLRAAYQAGLIHRDVKPGNILFADSRTAKIVDFGLAMLEQQAAEAAGADIWGTPYYVAPEKLDQQPEDLRSDIYSLGATLFHALAGRPPFEAEDASMVALKHLKNQAVSLQAFAPWVSGSTAFVINRTLLKDPDERYQNYDELIEHLEYAKNELLEKGATPQDKNRVILETEEDQKLWGYLTAGIVALFVTLGVGIFLFLHYHKSGDEHKTIASASAGADTGHSARYDAARTDLIAGKAEEAATAFHALAEEKTTPAPFRQWCMVHEGVSDWLADHPERARAAFASLAAQPYAAADPAGTKLSGFFQNLANAVLEERPNTPAEAKPFGKSDYGAISLLVFGLKDWASGDYESAGNMLREFASVNLTGESAWVADYRSLVGDYVADYTDYRGALALIKTAKSPSDLAHVRGEVEGVKKDLRRGRKLSEKLDAAMSAITDLGAAQARMIDELRPQLAALCANWSFGKALAEVQKLDGGDETAIRQKIALLRKVEWLIEFQKTLSADVASRGRPVPLTRTDHTEIKGEIANFGEKGVALKSGETIEWRSVAPESVLDLAQALAKLEKEPRQAARRSWLAGIYALLIGKKSDAQGLVMQAAAASESFREALPLVLPAAPTNLAREAKASASSETKTSEGAAQAIDGDLKTKWCSKQPAPQWLRLDLGKERSMQRWTVKHAHAGGENAKLNTADFQLQQSADGSGWTDVDAVANESSDVTSRTVAPFSCRYLRLLVTKPNQDKDPASRIFEFEAYGPPEGLPKDLFAASQDGTFPNLVGMNFGPGDAGGSTSTIDPATGTFTIAAGGADIWFAEDSFRFLSRPIGGNGEVCARVESVEPADPWSKCGVMFRENLTPEARNAYICATAANGVSYQVRKETRGTTTNVGDRSIHPPCWVKLVREADTFTGYASEDGINWKRIGNPETISMDAKSWAGVAASSHNIHALSACTVNEVRVSGE